MMKRKKEMMQLVRICVIGIAMTMVLSASAANAYLEGCGLQVIASGSDILVANAPSCPPGYRTCGSGCCPT